MTLGGVLMAPGKALTTHAVHCLQALDARIAEALDCPCVEDLKAGPCGDLFVRTFTCYQKSRAEPKGCDCLDASLAFAVSALL